MVVCQAREAKQALSGNAIPTRFNIIRFEQLPSTNTWLNQAAETGVAGPGTVVVADFQSQGRGRQGRSWICAPGQGLAMSVLLEALLPPQQTALVSLLAGLSVKSGLEEYLNTKGVQQPRLELRWPNDLLHHGRKIAGILCESATGTGDRRMVVMGIGVNINQAESDFPSDLRTPAASLYVMTGKVEDPRCLLPFILSGIDEYASRLEREGPRWIVREWLAESGVEGRSVILKTGEEVIVGIAAGLDDDGAMIIHKDNGRRIIRSGDLVEMGWS